MTLFVSPVKLVTPTAFATTATDNTALSSEQTETIRAMLCASSNLISYYNFNIKVSIHEIFNYLNLSDVALIGSTAIHVLGAKYVTDQASKAIPVPPHRAAEMEQELKISPADKDWRATLPENWEYKDLRHLANNFIKFMLSKSTVNFEDGTVRQELLKKVQERYPERHKDWDWLNIYDSRFIFSAVEKLLFDKFKIVTVEGNIFLVIGLNLDGTPHDLLFKVKMARTYRFPIQSIEIPLKNILSNQSDPIIPTCSFDPPSQPYVDLVQKKVRSHQPHHSDAFSWLCNQVRKGWTTDSEDRRIFIKTAKEHYTLETFLVEFKRFAKVHLHNDSWAVSVYIISLLPLAPEGFLEEVRPLLIKNEEHTLSQIFNLPLTKDQLYAYLQFYIELTNTSFFETPSGTYHLNFPCSVESVIPKLKDFPRIQYPHLMVVCSSKPVHKNVAAAIAVLYETHPQFAIDLAIWAKCNPNPEWLKKRENLPNLKLLFSILADTDEEFCLGCVKRGFFTVIDSDTTPKVLKLYIKKIQFSNDEFLKRYLAFDLPDPEFYREAYKVLYKKQSLELCEQLALAGKFKIDEVQWLKIAQKSQRLEDFYNTCSMGSINCWMVLANTTTTFEHLLILLANRQYNWTDIDAIDQNKIYLQLMQHAWKLYNALTPLDWVLFYRKLSQSMQTVTRKNRLNVLMEMIPVLAKEGIFEQDLMGEALPIEGELFTQPLLDFLYQYHTSLGRLVPTIYERFKTDSNVPCRSYIRLLEVAPDQEFIKMIVTILNQDRTSLKESLVGCKIQFGPRFLNSLKYYLSLQVPLEMKILVIQSLMANKKISLLMSDKELSDIVHGVMHYLKKLTDSNMYFFKHLFEFYQANLGLALMRPHLEIQVFVIRCDFIIKANKDKTALELLRECLECYRTLSMPDEVLLLRKQITLSAIAYHLTRKNVIHEKDVLDLKGLIETITPNSTNSYFDLCFDFILLCVVGGQKYDRIRQDYVDIIIKLNSKMKVPALLIGCSGEEHREVILNCGKSREELLDDCSNAMLRLAELPSHTCRERIFEIERMFGACASSVILNDLLTKSTDEHVAEIHRLYEYVQKLGVKNQFKFMKALFNFRLRSLTLFPELDRLVIETFLATLVKLEDEEEIYELLKQFKSFNIPLVLRKGLENSAAAANLLIAFNYKIPTHPDQLTNRKALLDEFLLQFADFTTYINPDTLSYL